MNTGYARVSTADQHLDAQLDALTAAGCARIYQEHKSAAGERPELNAAIDSLEAGDVLVVWKLDRLCRSVADLVDLLRRLEGRGAGLRCLTQPIDTTSPAGRLLLTMLGAVAEFERDLIRERTAEGLEAARRRGRKGGRPRLVHGPRVQAARQMHAEGRTPRHICAALQISRSTLYRWLAIEAA